MATKPSLEELQSRVLELIDEERIVAVHRGLVQIPSVNPPGDCADAIAYVEKPFREADFEIDHIVGDEAKPNLVVKYGPEGGRQLLVNAHVDVVPTGERSAWKYDPFGAEVVDGKINGRGAGDDKASVTFQAIATLMLKESGIPMKGRLLCGDGDSVSGHASIRISCGGSVGASHARCQRGDWGQHRAHRVQHGYRWIPLDRA